MNVYSFLLKTTLAIFFLGVCSGCKGEIPAAGKVTTTAAATTIAATTAAATTAAAKNAAPSNGDLSLTRIAEIERAGAFFPGLALLESELREKAGDFSGAAIAAYKELSRAYGYGSVTKSQVEEGLENALALFGARYTGPEQSSSCIAAINGCMAFAGEDWERAEELLSLVLKPEEEPDSFLRWMLLVCSLERKGKHSGYGAIRARYALFPEYWYRGARAFSIEDANIAASYAEQCINTSPLGPFAADCRKILAHTLGLGPGGIDAQQVSSAALHSGILTKAEIEHIIRGSVSAKNPALLEELFPLMALPENPYTLYALGVLKTLSSVPEYRSFFTERALRSKGRLAERLNYISRG